MLISDISKSPWVKWTLACLAIKLCLVIVGIAVTKAFGLHFSPGSPAWLATWYRWDVIDFYQVTLNGYQPGTPDAHLIVRFPIVPLMIRGIALLCFQNIFVAGFVMATLVSLPIPVLMEKLAALDHPAAAAGRAAWLMLIFPMSFCLHLPLTEGIFLVLVLNTFLAARSGDWLQASLSAALASATRINGVLLLPALLAEAAYQYHLQRAFRRQWLWLLISPLGIAAYCGLSYYLYGSVFAYIKYQPEYCNQHIAWPWVGVANLFHAALTSDVTNRILYFYPQCLAVILLVVAAIWTCKKCRPSYVVWTLLNILLFTSTTFILSIQRYAVAVFPIFFFLAGITERKPVYTGVKCLSFSMMIYCAALFAAGWWAF